MDRKEKLKRIQPTRIADPEAIKQAIPLVQNLHPSFWENPKFLRWQLVRLNRQYQKDADDMWWKVWTWIEKEWVARYGISVSAKAMHLGYPPFPEEIHDLFYRHSDGHASGYGLILNLDNYVGFNSSPYQQEPFEDWRIRQGHDTSLIDLWKRHLPHEKDNRKKKMRSSILPFKLSDLLMPWTVRFPPFHYLQKLPDWPEQRQGGRPLRWALNLLVFELSQAGMNDSPIARLIRKSANDLLYGIVKSYTDRSDKDPFLVRIDDIKKRVERIVSRAYPFPAAT